MATCPTCGQHVTTEHEVQRILAVMTVEPERYLYRSIKGAWHMKRGGGPYSPSAVEELKRQGKIRSVYSDCPDEAYGVRRTFDVARSMEARKKYGKSAPVYYVGDPHSCHETDGAMK